jgi:septin family protein
MLSSLVRPVLLFSYSKQATFGKKEICYLMGSFWLSGQTGLGKSTLINTIFASHLIDSKGRREADEPVRQTTEIQTVSHGAVFSLLRFNFVTLRVAPLTRMP